MQTSQNSKYTFTDLFNEYTTKEYSTTLSNSILKRYEKMFLRKYKHDQYEFELFKLNEDVPVRVFDADQDIDWEKAEKEIFLTMNWHDLKNSETGEMEDIVRNLMGMSSETRTMEWLNKLFLKNNDNPLFICTLLHVISHMEYEEVYPNGPTMAMASLTNKDERVVGYGIKAFANWNVKNTLPYMRCNEPGAEWAKKEWLRVIEYIEEHGDEASEIPDENDRLNERMDTRTA